MDEGARFPCAANCGLRISDCGLGANPHSAAARNKSSAPRNHVDFISLPISDCRFWIANCGLRMPPIGNPKFCQSEIRNPQSPIRNLKVLCHYRGNCIRSAPQAQLLSNLRQAGSHRRESLRSLEILQNRSRERLGSGVALKEFRDNLLLSDQVYQPFERTPNEKITHMPA